MRSERSKKRKLTLHQNMLELYSDKEKLKEKLDFERQRVFYMGDNFKVFHPVCEFVLTYDLFPPSKEESVYIAKERLLELYMEFIDTHYPCLKDSHKDQVDQIGAMWEKYGIDKKEYGARSDGKFRKHIYYIINKKNKLGGT